MHQEIATAVVESRNASSPPISESDTMLQRHPNDSGARTLPSDVRLSSPPGRVNVDGPDDASFLDPNPEPRSRATTARSSRVL